MMPFKKPWSGRIACQVCLEGPKPVSTHVGTGVGAFSDESKGKTKIFKIDIGIKQRAAERGDT